MDLLLCRLGHRTDSAILVLSDETLLKHHVDKSHCLLVVLGRFSGILALLLTLMRRILRLLQLVYDRLEIVFKRPYFHILVGHSVLSAFFFLLCLFHLDLGPSSLCPGLKHKAANAL